MNVATTTAARVFRAGYVMIEAGARGRDVRIDRGGPSIAPVCLTAGWRLRRTTISEYFKCCVGKRPVLNARVQDTRTERTGFPVA
jgi:hypothetical protein